MPSEPQREEESATPGVAWLRVVESVARIALWIAPALHLLAISAVFVKRLAYPFELDKMEGGTLEHVARWMDGKPLYTAPSVEWVPYAYTPLYYAVSAGAAHGLGLGFAPLRIVSFLATLGTLALIFRLVKRETGDRFSAWLAVGLYAACFPLTGGWYDVGRIDSLFLFFVLWAVDLLRGPGGAGRAALAGLAIGLGFLTKQTALGFGLALAPLAWARSARSLLAFGAVAGASIGGSALWLDATSDGWFRFYAFTLQSRQPTVPAFIPLLPLHDVWRPLAIPVALALAACADALEKRRLDALAFRVVFGSGVLALIWAARSSYGAYANILLPNYALLAILAGVGHGIVRARLGVAGDAGVMGRALLAVLLVLQLASLAYDPRDHVPSPRDREAGEALVARLRAIEGPVLVAHHGWLGTLAGKPVFSHGVAVSDLMLRDRDGPGGAAFRAAMTQAIRERRFAAVVTDTEWWFDAALAEQYERTGPIFEDPKVFYPVTGARSRPEWLWLRRADRAAGATVDPSAAAAPVAP